MAHCRRLSAASLVEARTFLVAEETDEQEDEFIEYLPENKLINVAGEEDGETMKYGCDINKNRKRKINSLNTVLLRTPHV